MKNFPFKIETASDGRLFFEVEEGEHYCDPKFCEHCAEGRAHTYNDRDIDPGGFSSNGWAYTGPDGSFWVGEDYSHDESSCFGWHHTRIRFWKQDREADAMKKRMRQVRDALNKCKDSRRLEEVARILGV